YVGDRRTGSFHQAYATDTRLNGALISTLHLGGRQQCQTMCMNKCVYHYAIVPQHSRNICMPAIISVSNLDKTYASGFQALKGITLAIHRGEIFALLGPNGAGKTTLISIICGLTSASAGAVSADGHDIVKDYRAARAKIGLVPQEL